MKEGEGVGREIQGDIVKMISRYVNKIFSDCHILSVENLDMYMSITSNFYSYIYMYLYTMYIFFINLYVILIIILIDF